MEKNEKVGLSKLDWILSISGIFLLSMLIVLPPLFRVVFEEKTEIPMENNPIVEDTDNTEIKINDDNYAKVMCMKQVTNTNYIENLVITLAHENQSLKVLTEDTIYTYLITTKDGESMYAEAKLACINITDDFKKVTGFNYSCDVKEDSVQITKKYDLANFKSTSVVDYAGVVVQLNSPFIADQSTAEITTSLTSQGYTCQ